MLYILLGIVLLILLIVVPISRLCRSPRPMSLSASALTERLGKPAFTSKSRSLKEWQKSCP